VETLQKSHDLLGAFFNDFKNYKLKASEHMTKLTKSPSKKEPPARSSLDKAVICSRMPHLKQIELRLNFLRFILHNSSLVLSPEQLHQLWDMSAADPSASDAEKEMVYSWLKDETSMMDPEGVKNLFETKMVKMSPQWCLICSRDFRDFFQEKHAELAPGLRAFTRKLREC
jgi:hypothetical protein